MIKLIRSLFSKREKDPGIPLEELTTTIAYPDGSRGTSHRHFAQTPQVDVVLESMLGELREPYPHVAERIALTWGSPNCEAYLASLLFDERAMDKGHQYVARMGFNPQIMSVLMQLQDEHHRRFTFSSMDRGGLL